jgi:hypothetical protein
MINLISAEEEIIAAVKEMLEKELPGLIEEVNDCKGEDWIIQPVTVKTDETGKERDIKPSVYISLTKMRKSIEDPFIEKGEYTVEFLILFDGITEKGMEFRYGAVLSDLLKKSEKIREVSDSALLKEIDFYKGDNSSRSGYRESIYRILLVREGF